MVSSLMYLLWAQKLARKAFTSTNKKGWAVTEDGWWDLEKGLEPAFFAEKPEYQAEYLEYKAKWRHFWGAAFWDNSQPFRQEYFVDFLKTKYQLTFESLGKDWEV